MRISSRFVSWGQYHVADALVHYRALRKVIQDRGRADSPQCFEIDVPPDLLALRQTNLGDLMVEIGNTCSHRECTDVVCGGALI